MSICRSLWRSMARAVLRVLRRRPGLPAPSLARAAGRLSVELPGPFGPLRLDSSAPVPGAPPTDADRLLAPLAGRLAGRAVAVAAVLETTNSGQRTHLLTVAQARPEFLPELLASPRTLVRIPAIL